MSDRAWAILGVGITVLSVGLTILLPNNRLVGQLGIVAGVVIAVYGLVHDRISSNKLILIFSEDPPYTFRDFGRKYQVEFRLGVRGSKRLPRDTRVLVINIQPRPSEHPFFRADYPYPLPQHEQKDDRELLFLLGKTWESSVGDLIFCGIQMDPQGQPAMLRLQPHETWDVALQVVAAEAKSIDAWMSIAAVNGRLKVRRYSWKPSGL